MPGLRKPVGSGRDSGVDGEPLPGPQPQLFDIVEWLASLGICPLVQIRRGDQSEQDGRLVATYYCGDEFLARVQLVAMTTLTTPSWELVAELADRVYTIVVPGGTRFAWR